MRFIRLLFVISFCLSGCASHSGILAGDAKPFTTCTLSGSHHYSIPQSANDQVWWVQFKDPQLNRLITLALQDSPTIHIAKSRLQQAFYIANEARAPLWPSLDASGYVERERFAQFGLVPPPFNGHTYNLASVGLNFNYEFDFWGKNRQLLAASTSEALAASAEIAEAKLIVATAVTATYFQLQSSLAAAQIAEQAATLRHEILVITKGRAQKGIQSNIPVKTAISDAETARINATQLKQNVLIFKHQLAVLIGKNPLNTTIEATPFRFHQQLLKLPPSIPANLLAARPDIIAAKMRTEEAGHQINAAKARFFPNINLLGIFSYQSVGFGHLFERTSQNNAISGAIDLPIFDAGARRANLGVSYAVYDEAVNNYNATILTALREVADQISIWHTVNTALKSEQISYKAIAQNLQLTRARYQHGIIDYLEVLESQGLVLQQESILVDLKARHYLAAVAIEKALGGSEFNWQGQS